MTNLAVIISFDRPWWWIVLIPVALLILWIGRKTLSGLSSRTRKVALAIRLVCVALIIGTLAEPQFRRTNTQMAVTVVLDASKSQPRQVNANFADAFKKWEDQNRNNPDNLLGLVTAARQSSVQIIPRRLDSFDIKDVGPTDATDLASGLRRAMAVMPPNAANRIVIVSDGNETMGDLMDAARSAEAARIPVDVLPVRYAIDREVIVDKLIAPATARPGEVAVLKVVLVSTKPAKGKLSVLMNGQPVDLDPSSDDLAAKIELVAGTNVQAVKQLTKQFEQMNVRMYVLGVGADWVQNKPGTQDLRRFVEAVHGTTFIASNDEEVRAAVAKINETEKSAVVLKSNTDYSDWYLPFLIASLVLWVAFIVFNAATRRTS